jgi:hypothetical protein
MSSDNNGCSKCGRKILQSISNRCMYCGADLPEEHHLSQDERAALFSAKFDTFKQNEENADAIISNLRRDFGIPEPKKTRKKRKQDDKAAMAAAIASAKIHNDGNDGSGC